MVSASKAYAIENVHGSLDLKQFFLCRHLHCWEECSEVKGLPVNDGSNPKYNHTEK